MKIKKKDIKRKDLRILATSGEFLLNLISDYGYKPENKSKLRKQALKKTITKLEFDAVVESLFNLFEDSEGYKQDRIRSDCQWLSKELEKGRFTSESFSPDRIKSEITDFEVYNA